MDYVIIFYVLGAIGLAIIGKWWWLLGEGVLGGAFLAISAMVYLMEGKKPAHEMEWRTPIFERIEEECGRVRASGVSAQLARRLRRYMKAQPPLEEGEYYAVFCGGEGVEVMRRGCPTVSFRYMACADGGGNVYVRLHSREAKRALAEMLAQTVAELPDVFVDKTRRYRDGAMFAAICDRGFEREDKKKMTA